MMLATPRPLLITTDTALLDEMSRLAAVAGVELDVVPDTGAIGDRRPPLVVLGADAARSGVARVRNRDGDPHLVLLSNDADDASVWRLALEANAEHVAVLPDAEPWLVDRLRQAADPRKPAPVVGVVGGRGGAGASTLAVALGVTAARLGRRAFLLDADPLGGGIDLLLGGEDAVGARWPQFATAAGALDAAALRDALPVLGDLAVLSWDRGEPRPLVPGVAASVLRSARLSNDIVVADLPRLLDDAAKEVAAACEVVLLVVPAEVRASAAGARVAARLLDVAQGVEVVVRGPAPAGLRAAAVAAAVGRPLAGFLRPEPRLAAASERGEPPARGGAGPLATFCEGFLERLERLDRGTLAADAVKRVRSA